MIKTIVFGRYELDTWYHSPYPEEYARLGHGYCQYGKTTTTLPPPTTTTTTTLPQQNTATNNTATTNNNNTATNNNNNTATTNNNSTDRKNNTNNSIVKYSINTCIIIIIIIINTGTKGHIEPKSVTLKSFLIISVALNVLLPLVVFLFMHRRQKQNQCVSSLGSQ
ncbi:hypothetical protein F7725_004067 [Dissostichus mawsoni]|uniref:MYST zinc finger domain-containing protein n=1 Tax=Dissostichus mawsoni TaxID=36200 RepID=A0A7J5YDY9_DISMA|nr:hypothetical protein F7725_004067 [Dissostichus mawsoni]